MKYIYFFILLIACSFVTQAQSWNLLNTDYKNTKGIRDFYPQKYLLYEIDDEEIHDILWTSPMESQISANNSTTILNLPTAEGIILSFSIVEFDMMEQALQEKFPDFKTFYGVGTHDPYASCRIDYTAHGLRATIKYNGKKTFIDYFVREDKSTKIVYFEKDYHKTSSWGCHFDPSIHTDRSNSLGSGSRIGDCAFRSYRLALATTGEYSAFHGGTEPLVMSAVMTAVNRVNEVYEYDFAVRLILIGNTNLLFYYNGATDPYTNDDGGAMLSENQTTVDNIIGSANYDIGHVFSTGGGGVAFLGAVCNNGIKAGGVTGSGAPIGDPFTIDYVAHEMGHQFAGNHTQNNSCNRNGSTAMEPGSASTIMGYAGICSPDVQSNSDDYFHAISIQETKNFIFTGGGSSCDQFIAGFSNSPPVITSQPSTYNIPVSTPFELMLIATDPEGNAIKYQWDQMDNQVATMPPVSTNTGGPTFRSIDPTPSPTRLFPNLSTILSGQTSNTWEVIPSVARTMNFRGIARDFTGTAGCNSESNVAVVTRSGTSAFSITSHNTPSSWNVGEQVTITWNVGGTTANGVNCANVIILFSTDGGTSFDTLVTSTPNDGSHLITVPNQETTLGRIKVKGANNIFFDINNANITVVNVGPNFSISANPANIEACQVDQKTSAISSQSISGYTVPITLSTTGLPAGCTGSFAQTTINPGESTTFTLVTNNPSPGSYNFSILGTSGANNKVIPMTLQVAGSITSAPILSLPSNGAIGQSIRPLLVCNTTPFATSYTFQLSSNPNFSSPLINTTVTSTSFQVPVDLANETLYYWRVKASNLCSESDWSTVFSFTTRSCVIYSPSDLPLTISSGPPSEINSYINVTDKGTVSDINIINLEGTHSYMDDLRFFIYAPSNSNVRYWNRPCGDDDNFDINFDQSAANSNWPCPPTDGNTYIPSASLNTLNGLTIKGTWRMRVQDLVDQDGGSLTNYQLEVCANDFCRLRVDNTNLNGIGSLLYAINCASSGDTITFAPNLNNSIIDVATSGFTIDKSLTILAQPNQNISIVSNSTSPLFTINSGVQNFELIEMKLSSTGTTSTTVLNNGIVTLNNSTITNASLSGTSSLTNENGAKLILIGNTVIKE